MMHARARRLCNIVAMVLWMCLVIPVTRAEQLEIPGREYTDKEWSFNDLLCGEEEVLEHVRARIGEIRRGSEIALRGGGTMDIGDIAVLEDDGTFVLGNNITDIIAITNAFYATHTDEYDEIIVFVASTYPGNVEPEAGFAFFLLVNGFVGGINRFQGIPDETGGITRLLGLLNMNDLPEYPADFTEDFHNVVGSGVEILGQESEHAWGAFVQTAGFDILGRGDSHWSFFLHHPGVGNASPMEGNRWQDNGDGTFTTVESFTGFSELDEYLMGLRPAGDVLPYYLITSEDDICAAAPDDVCAPALNVTVTGTRNDLSIQDIIDNHGPRIPDTITSAKTFKVAFVLIIPQGTTASAEDLAKTDSFRIDWRDYFSSETEGLGTMDTTLSAGPITTLPFCDDFNGVAPNVADWIFNQGATISDLGIGEPSGNSALRMNSNAGGGDEIRSRVLDLSGFATGEVTVSYSVQRTGGGNSPESSEDLLVEYFNNLEQWVILGDPILGNGPDETTFTAVDDTLPDDGLHSEFRLRFRRLQGSVGEFDDYFVDDVSINAATICICGDFDRSGTVNLQDFGSFALCFGKSILNAPECTCTDLDGDGVVNLVDFATFALLFGNRANCQSPPTCI